MRCPGHVVADIRATVRCPGHVVADLRATVRCPGHVVAELLLNKAKVTLLRETSLHIIIILLQ